MLPNMCIVKLGSFKPCQNQHNSVKDNREKGKKSCNVDPKIAMKIYVPVLPT